MGATEVLVRGLGKTTRVRPDQRGAALVEFAMILPLFMTLVLGMFTGGLAYNRDLSITHAAREGARYGAVLSKIPPSGLAAAAWTAAVKDRVVEAAAGDLDLTAAGHYVCVALVDPAGATFGSYVAVFGDVTTATSAGFTAATGCYNDALTDTVGRVHVAVGAPGEIQTIVFKTDLKLRSKGTARYEAA